MELNWEAVGSVGTIAVVVLGAVWNDGRFKQWIKTLAAATDTNTKQISEHRDVLANHASELRVQSTRVDGHETRIHALEQWNQGFDSAARVSNKMRVPHPKGIHVSTEE